MASAMKKSVLSHLWEIEQDTLDKASQNHFRAYSDVTQYLIRYWQLCTGDFLSRKTLGKVCFIDMQNYQEIACEIAEQKWQMVSLNENCTSEEFKIIRKEINAAFEQILPDKSSFEK